MKPGPTQQPSSIEIDIFLVLGTSRRARICGYRVYMNFNAHAGYVSHFPAFAVALLKTHTCMMARRVGVFENNEFPKNSINIDKFTGFIDKYL